MEVVAHYILNDFAGARNLINMSLSVQRLVVESFKFNGKHVISVYVKDIGQCLVSKYIDEAIEYEKEDGIRAIQRLVPENLATLRVIWRRVWTILSVPNLTLY